MGRGTRYATVALRAAPGVPTIAAMPAAPATSDAYRAGPLLRAWRRASRLVRGTAATVLLSGAWAAGRPFQRGRERAAAWDRRWFRRWGRALCRIGRIEIEVEGVPPRGPCVLVTNHVGYVDVLALSAVIDGPSFVSMHEIRGWPLVGPVAARMGTIFVDRSDKRAIPAVNAAIERALADGRVVVLFAEGANSDGTFLRPFRAPLLEPAARASAPCAWGVTHYSVLPGDPPASRSVCWYQDPIVQQAPRFLALEAVRARLAFGDERVSSSDRKELAQALHARVAARFVPME